MLADEAGEKSLASFLFLAFLGFFAGSNLAALSLFGAGDDAAPSGFPPFFPSPVPATTGRPPSFASFFLALAFAFALALLSSFSACSTPLFPPAPRSPPQPESFSIFLIRFISLSRLTSTLSSLLRGALEDEDGPGSDLRLRFLERAAAEGVATGLLLEGIERPGVSNNIALVGVAAAEVGAKREDEHDSSGKFLEESQASR